MGGIGSGRHGGRQKCEATPRLGVDELLVHPWVPDGFRIPGYFARTCWYAVTRKGDRMVLEAHWLTPPRTFEIWIDRSPQPLGGARCYVVCPRCRCRSVHVYWREGGFGCRRCHRLAYTSQSETVMARAGRRFRKLKQIIGNAERKPYRMRQATFERLRSEYQNRMDLVYKLWLPGAHRVLDGKRV